jgi:anti-sigma factor RsiW
VEVTVDDQPHLVYWLSKRVGTRLKLPVLTAVGFELMGGRLLPDTAGPLAQLMYQDAQGRRITFYVRNESEQGRDSAFRWVKEGNVEVCFWVDGHVGYAVAGEFERRELYRLANAIYQQING